LDHKRNLYRVIIGKAGVVFAQKVNDLDAQIRSATGTIRIKRATIDGRAPSGFGLDDFVSLPADPDIDIRIAEKERELEAVQQSAQLKARAGLSQVTVQEVPTGLGELLRRTIAGLSAIVEQRIAAHIAEHKM
jgi:hypothetical protein